MSKLAGVLLFVLGCGGAYFGISEISHQVLLTKFAAFTTGGVGVGLCLVGLMHFVAPHKAFLSSIPLLITMLGIAYTDLSFYFARTEWKYLAILVGICVVILTLSYRGYLAQKAKMPAAV
jgi:hypothetical protein